MSGFITCSLSGGVGNQLFQIAHVYALSKELNLELILAFNTFEGCGQGSHPTKYYNSLYSKLNFVNKLLPVAVHAIEYKFAYNPEVKAQLKAFVEKCKNVGIQTKGCFQSIKYFQKYEDEIRQLFTPQIGIKNYLKQNYPKEAEKFSELFDDENAVNTCFLGVRRGDYVEKKDYYVPCHISYFEDAIEAMGRDKDFYVASDDLDWCKQNFKGDNFIFFDITDDLPQLLLGTLFKNYIISNSTFHWWASYLSAHDKKRVFAPDIWLNENGYESIYRSEMEVIERKYLL